MSTKIQRIYLGGESYGKGGGEEDLLLVDFSDIQNLMGFISCQHLKDTAHGVW